MGDCAWAGMGVGKIWFSMSFAHIGTFEDIHCLLWSSMISVHSGCGIHCLIWTSVSLLGSPWRYGYFWHAQSLSVHWFSSSHLCATVTKASHLPSPLPHCRVGNSEVLPAQMYTTVIFSLGFCLLWLNLDSTNFSGVLYPALGLA